MAIRGSLQEAALPDVIQLLHLGRRTGCLALADRGSHASLYFQDGWVVHATIVNRPDRLGDMLVKSGRITPVQLEQAIAMQKPHHRLKLGEVLVGLGALSREEVRAYVLRQTEEAVYALFTWRSGAFTFEPGLGPEPDVEQVRIAADVLLLEGARRVDEWGLIEKKIPNFDLMFAMDPTASPSLDLDFTEVQRRLLPLLDGSRDVRALVEEVGLTEFEVCQALFGLAAAGVIHRVGTSTPPTSARSRDLQIEEHRNLGVAFYRTGMLEEAVREFRRVMELRPSEGAAPFHLGLIAARQGRWADAAYFFRRAVDRAGPRTPILHNLGVALAMAGEPEQADAVLADVTGRSPEDPRTHLAWGTLALDRGEPRLALARLERAGELFGDARPPVWYWAMARACARSDDLDHALAIAREGIEQQPDHPVLLNNYAVLLEAAGELLEAETTLRHALERDPGLPQLSKNLGDVLYRLGRFEEAWDAYERAERLEPALGDDLHFRMGNLALRRGDLTAARDHWNRAVALNPGHQLARANLQTVGPAPAA